MKRRQQATTQRGDLPKTNAGIALKTLLKLIWQTGKGYYAVLALQAVLGAASSLINLALPKLLIDGLHHGWPWTRFVQGILLFALGKYALLQTLSALQRQDKVYNEYFGQRLPMVFAQKVMRLSYPHLEDPQVLDLKERALFPVTNYGALNNLLRESVSMLTGALTLGGIAALLFGFSPLFLLVLFLLCVVSTMLSARFIKYMREQQQQLIPVNRKYGYWSNTAHQEKHQKEYRIYGLHDAMNARITEYAEEIARWLHTLYRRQGNNEVLQSLITALIRVMAYGYTALRVLSVQYGHQITLGDYSVIIMATENFFHTFTQSFQGLLYVLTSLHHLMPFSQFMLLPEAEQSGGLMPGPMETLTFEGVTFRYPAGDRIILDDISFEIKAGEKISIVGLNNAGKSTIVKLICRLFEPTQGRILWNGTDIRAYDYEAYLSQLSCVFQDFFLFPFTIRDNIDPQGDGADDDIRAVLEQTDMLDIVNQRPQGINTYLNKSIWDDATDFSGGERQKLAIARSLYRPSGLVILDEPTAALDPLAESEVYEHFHQLTRGRTAIFISHRMSSSTFCDRILLLQDGKVAAFDSHRNLMRGHNLYRQLFEAQAQHFKSQPAALVDEGMRP